MLFNFSLLPQVGRDIVVDSFIMIVHCDRKHLLGKTLANNILVEVVINLAEKREKK